VPKFADFALQSVDFRAEIITCFAPEAPGEWSGLRGAFSSGNTIDAGVLTQIRKFVEGA
jgi:hypothetical protein